MSQPNPTGKSNFDQKPRENIQITIVDDSRRRDCEAHCGEDWSTPNTISLVNQRIAERFSNRIEIEYLDLSKISAGCQAFELGQTVKDRNLSLPSLFINGEPRLSGRFDIRQLLDAIEVKIEMET